MADDNPRREESVFVKDFPHQLNTEILAQFSGASTEPYTGHVSNMICKDFRISIKGQRSMSNTINNLPVYRTPDSRLTFGWADHNLIRSRLVHKGAYEHLAIMIALSEAFHESYAARVMFEMAQMVAGTGDITPHFRQWKSVIRSLNGAFATTDFGIVVEDYIRMDPYSINVGANHSMVKIPIPAKTLAEALMMLGKLSSGKEKQLTVTGSVIIAWLAAVADWLFDLRISIFDSNRQRLHSTHPDQDTQALFVFCEKPGCHVSNSPWTHSDDHQVSIAHTSSTPKPASQLSYSLSVHNTPLTGRVVWQSLLPRVFGQAYHHLDHEASQPFATMLGAAANLFQQLALGHHPEPSAHDLVSSANKSNTASYGPGLIQTLTNWLPELRRFQGRMDRQLKLEHADAATAYRDSLNALRKLCACGICKPLPMDPTPADPDPLSPLPDIDSLTLSSPTPAPKPPPKNGYCLPTLTETILVLGLTLSRTIVSASLYPSRAGIQSLYHSQVQRRLAARGKHWTQHFRIVYGAEWNAAGWVRLVNTLQIFAGRKPGDRGEGGAKLVGVRYEGVCAYFQMLETGAVGRSVRGEGQGEGEGEGDEVRLIRVVSGGINVGYKVFERVCLGEVVGEEWDDPWERVWVEHLDEVLCCK